MNTKQETVVDEIIYLLKFKTKQVTTINLNYPASIEAFSDLIMKLIKEENIPVLLYLADRDKLRFTILLDTDPVWAFICKSRNDKWDYMEEIHDIAEAYNGRDDH